MAVTYGPTVSGVSCWNADDTDLADKTDFFSFKIE